MKITSCAVYKWVTWDVVNCYTKNLNLDLHLSEGSVQERQAKSNAMFPGQLCPLDWQRTILGLLALKFQFSWCSGAARRSQFWIPVYCYRLYLLFPSLILNIGSWTDKQQHNVTWVISAKARLARIPILTASYIGATGAVKRRRVC